MDAVSVIRELGGGAIGVMVAGLGFAVVMLWRRVTALQDKLFDTLQTSSREQREMQAATNTALSANSAALAALAAEMRGRSA